MNSNSINRLIIILLFGFIGINLSLSAQESLQIIRGTIRDSRNYEPISFALIKNQMLKTKIIADEQGRYTISFKQGDLLKITAIGYEDGFYIINDTSEIVNDFPIQLKSKIYELKEFTLTPYKTILQFKNAFVQLELPKDKPTPELNLPFYKVRPPDNNGDDLGGVSFTSPISAIYNTFSHRGKMMKKYKSLMTNDYNSKIVQKRFTRNLVAKIVPIKTTDELDAFIEFCKFDFNFLLTASEYELILAVQKKYLEYIRYKMT